MSPEAISGRYLTLTIFSVGDRLDGENRRFFTISLASLDEFFYSKHKSMPRVDLADLKETFRLD